MNMNLHLASIKKLFEKSSSLETTGRILVLDGHDVIGYRVVDQLAYLDYPMIRVGVRNTQDYLNTKRWDEMEYTIEKVTFDWCDESTYDLPLEDVKTVFVTTPMTPSNWDENFPKFLEACHRAKVKKIVKLSFYHSIQSKAENPRYGNFGSQDNTTDPIHNVPFVKKHALCDGDLILRKEFNSTILFATHLMSNVFCYGFDREALKKDKEFYGASQGQQINYVSPNDVADMAITAIFDKSHTREGYNVLGPFPLTDVEVAALLSECLHTTVTYVEKPIDFFEKDTAALENIKASGMEKDFPHGDFKRIMNRSPQSFREYLKDKDRMSPTERHVVGAFSPMHLDELTVVSRKRVKEEEKEEIEPVDGGEGFEVKAAAAETDDTDQVKPQVVAQ